jgi:pimeloyl-ACP methyl ester carboxylesterase
MRKPWRGGFTSPADPDGDWQAIDWPTHTYELILRGRRVRYVDIGRGPAVVLVHGQGGSWRWWLRVMPAMAVDARVIALDLAGFGESDPVVDGDVFDEQVKTVVGLLDHLGFARAIVVGHSMGGLVSLRVACDHPDRLRGLALVDAGGGNIGPRRLALIVVAFRIFNVLFARRWVAHLITRNRWLRAALLALAVADPRSVSTALAVEIIPRMASPGFTSSLEAAAKAVRQMTPEDVSCPSLVVWGARDRILPVSSGRKLALRIPDARFVPLNGVGHCPMVEAPDRLSRLLSDFVRHREQPITGATDLPERHVSGDGFGR